MEEPLEEVCQGTQVGWGGDLGNRLGMVKDVSQVDGELKFGDYLLLLAGCRKA